MGSDIQFYGDLLSFIHDSPLIHSIRPNKDETFELSCMWWYMDKKDPLALDHVGHE